MTGANDLPFYIATVWIEHRHDPASVNNRRLVTRLLATDPIEFRMVLEGHYQRLYENCDVHVGPISESIQQRHAELP